MSLRFSFVFSVHQYSKWIFNKIPGCGRRRKSDFEVQGRGKPTTSGDIAQGRRRSQWGNSICQLHVSPDTPQRRRPSHVCCKQHRQLRFLHGGDQSERWVIVYWVTGIGRTLIAVYTPNQWGKSLHWSVFESEYQQNQKWRVAHNYEPDDCTTQSQTA